MTSKKKTSIPPTSLRRLQGLMGAHYDMLRALAKRVIAQHALLQRAAGPDRVSPSSLVADATLRLLLQRTTIRNDEHLQGLAAESMKRALKDRARRRGAKRRTRTGAAERKEAIPAAEPAADLLQALEVLRAVRPRQADVVRLVGVQGVSPADAARRLGISVPTLERDLRAARAWLSRRVRGD
jgi:RNA polymerase sigma factor (TIGR02999 family)